MIRPWADSCRGILLGSRGGLNIYLYAAATPLVFLDPSGLKSAAEWFLTLTGGQQNTFLDRWGNRLHSRKKKAGICSGVGTVVNSRRTKEMQIPGQTERTNRLASRLVRLGRGTAAKFVRRAAPVAQAVGGIIDTYILSKEAIYAAYDIPPGAY